jgi:hypothetical protein
MQPVPHLLMLAGAGGRLRLHGHDQRVEQRLLVVEVMVERAAGDARCPLAALKFLRVN